jgi:hypothetical protein
MSARELDDEHGDDGAEQDPVKRAEVGEHAEPPPVEPGQKHGRGCHSRNEHDRLRAGEECEQTDAEKHELPQHRRSFEHQYEGERDAREDGIEDRLRHQCARVHHRWNRDGEGRGQQRRQWRQYAPREEIDRDRRQRHQH